MDRPEILVTGATGFVGSKLVQRLRDTGPLRVFVRDAAKLSDPDGLDVVEGDIGDRDDLNRALDGISVAYYLVHSMEPGQDSFADRDRELASTFVDVCNERGVERLIYLGGVRGEGRSSEHLESRNAVEDVLGGGEASLVALRASMVVGAQSDSFRTLAQIVERLPALALPTWRDTQVQPIGIEDVIDALDAARDVHPGGYDVAGPDRLSVQELCGVVGELQGNRKPTFDLPFSSSKLEGAAAATLVDSDRAVLEPLLGGLHEDLVVEENSLEPVFGVEPTPFRAAAAAALAES